MLELASAAIKDPKDPGRWRHACFGSLMAAEASSSTLHASHASYTSIFFKENVTQAHMHVPECKT